MPDFDVEAFVTKLDRMGMKLTAVPLADGKLRINRWRMLDACEHAQQIQDLWTTQIGNDQARIDVLAAHLAEAAPRAAGYGAIPPQMRLSSQSIAVPDAAREPHIAQDSRRTASQLGAAVPRPSGAQMPTSAPTTAAPPPRPTVPQRAVERPAGVSVQIGAQAAPGAPKPQGPQVSPERQAATQTAAASPPPAGRPGASAQPMRSGPAGTTGTSTPESIEAALERLTRRTVSPQRGTGTPSPVGSQNKR